jgi:hypothetical protein
MEQDPARRSTRETAIRSARDQPVCSPVLVARLAPDAAIGLWRSLVARLVRDEEAAGSNPVSPTM